MPTSNLSGAPQAGAAWVAANGAAPMAASLVIGMTGCAGDKAGSSPKGVASTA